MTIGTFRESLTCLLKFHVIWPPPRLCSRAVVVPDQTAPSAPAVLASVNALVGIDDTDNDSSPGTGFLAQRLMEALAAEGLALPCGATRHQLLVDPRVPYTSHNSSACLALAVRPGVELDAVEAAAARFLREHAAPGSDPGLAVASRDLAGGHREAAVAFGRLAKTDLLDQATARSVAAAHGIRLSGHGGTEDGVIGALAAVGLHLSGTDGFFLWLDGIRSLRAGRYPVADLLRALPVDDARTASGERPAAGEIVEVSPWVRPLLVDGRAVLLLEHTEPQSDEPSWRTASRDLVRQH